MLLVIATLSACGEAAKPPARPNVVLIVVDTLRADRLPFHGAPRNTAPFLDQLAEQSWVFENAYSPSSWTLPSLVSVLTSVHPFQHGVVSLVGLELEAHEEPVPVNCIPPEIETPAEVLQANGYRTFGVASNLLVTPEVGFDRGFDRFVQLDDEPAHRVNAQVALWRNEILESEPFFLYLHYIDPSAAAAGHRLVARGDGGSELYDTLRDPYERTDVASHHPEIVADLQRRIESLRGSATRYSPATCLPAPADEKRLERLRAIGYLDDEADG